MTNEDILPADIENSLSIFNLEKKEDSQERLEAVEGIDTKLVLFAPEFNCVKSAAIQAALNAIKVDFSWSNHKDHVLLNHNGIDTIQLLVMDVHSEELFQNATEITLLIERYKGKKRERCKSIAYELTIIAFDNSQSEGIGYLSDKTGIDKEFLLGGVQNLPFTFFSTSNVGLSNEIISGFSAKGYGQIIDFKIQNENKYKQSGWKLAVYPDPEIEFRPNKIAIDAKHKVLILGYDNYFKPIIDQYSQVRARGYPMLKNAQKDFVLLRFRIQAIINGQLFTSNVKEKIKMSLKREPSQNIENLYKFKISHKLI